MKEKTNCVSEGAYKHLATECYDICTLGRSHMESLESIFSAILKESGKNTDAHNLAGVGQYLTLDWGNAFDCMAGEHKEKTKSSLG